MKLEEIETQEDFDEQMEIYKTSNAPLEMRQEYIKKLRAMYPEFDNSNRLPSKEIFQMMKDGEADISDIGFN
ncbi:hypothetical protein [Sulfurospirillum sp. UCH001]|uniref:hypothetical protein n=1 Tax=Sulfurospirillum sp. UCH001 TaxID=1581011 RepID=UPI000831BD6C|nr:hypothetical protein [Sulfurospirillum sp. UCH001]